MQLRRFLAPVSTGVLLVLLLVPLALALRSAPTAATDPILEIHTDSLSSYLYSGASNVQDIQPTVGHRGTNLDGSLRSRPFQAMELRGNPFESAWSAASVSGVRLDTGTFVVEDVDIALPAEGFGWVIGRSYNARQHDGSAYRDSNGYQGKNWFQSSQPEIRLYDHPTDAAKDLLYLIYGADRFVEYQRTGASSNNFKATNGASGIFEFTAASGGEPETYTLSDHMARELTFFGFDLNAAPAEGQLWTIEDADLNKAYVGHATTGSTAISSGYDSTTGAIKKAYDTSDRRYTYTYATHGGAERLTEVIVEAKAGGTWASPTGLSTVGKVNYEYYGSDSDTYGDAGDLKLVEITTPLTDAGVESVAKKYYRYWEGVFNASSNPGHSHALKYIVDFEGTRQHDWAGDNTFDEDFLTETEANLKAYASAYFEYDTEHRIAEGWFNGECGCSGAATGTHYFEYEDNGSFSDTASAYDEEWKFRTVVQRPDGTYLTQCFDEAHQGLDRILTDADPDNTSPAPARWVTHVVRDSSGLVTEVRTPASTDTYTHSTGGVTSLTSAGLIHLYTREGGSVATQGYVTAKKWKEGTSGGANYAATGEWEYDTFTKEIGASTGDFVVRPVIDKVNRFAEVVTSPAGSRIETDPAPTAHSSSTSWSKTITTLPAIASEENGSGSSDSTTESGAWTARGTSWRPRMACSPTGATRTGS